MITFDIRTALSLSPPALTRWSITTIIFSSGQVKMAEVDSSLEPSILLVMSYEREPKIYANYTTRGIQSQTFSFLFFLFFLFSIVVFIIFSKIKAGCMSLLTLRVNLNFLGSRGLMLCRFFLIRRVRRPFDFLFFLGGDP